MKGQDIVLLLKLLSIEKSASAASETQYSVRQLEVATGISKSELSAALNRCIRVGLAARDHQTGIPKVNRKALLGFLLHGIKYVFPAKPAELVRGIAFALNRPARLVPVPLIMMQTVAKLLGKRAAVERLTQSLVVDNSSICRELAWSPPYSLVQGLQLTADWYRSCKSGQSA